MIRYSLSEKQNIFLHNILKNPNWTSILSTTQLNVINNVLTNKLYTEKDQPYLITLRNNYIMKTDTDFKYTISLNSKTLGFSTLLGNISNINTSGLPVGKIYQFQGLSFPTSMGVHQYTQKLYINRNK